MAAKTERIYTYSLSSHGNIKHIVDPTGINDTLCGRWFLWSVWDSENFDLSELKLCKQCERKANRIERKGEKVGS